MLFKMSLKNPNLLGLIGSDIPTLFVKKFIAAKLQN